MEEEEEFEHLLFVSLSRSFCRLARSFPFPLFFSFAEIIALEMETNIQDVEPIQGFNTPPFFIRSLFKRKTAFFSFECFVYGLFYPLLYLLPFFLFLSRLEP